MLMQRKRKYRRERDDIKRGHWEVTEPLTPDKDNELQELKNYDLWEEFINPTTWRPDWRLRDPTQQPRYDELARKDKEHKGSVNFLDTRLPPREYYITRGSIEKRTWLSRSPIRETTRHRLPFCLNIPSAQLPTPDKPRRTTA
ncbi:MAG: hypothetical protein ACKPKO_57530 [Candidatus Fonsibacter sp.]